MPSGAFGDMKTSDAGLGLIKRFEDEPGFRSGRCTRLKAYKPVAGDVWTIGWGRAHGIHEGMEITPEEADALLLEDVLAVEAELAPMLRGVALTQGQWDALVSLGFNLKGGARAIPIKAPRFWKALHAGDKQKAVMELVDINHGPGGVVLPGLTRRRQAEAELFLT